MKYLILSVSTLLSLFYLIFSFRHRKKLAEFKEEAFYFPLIRTFYCLTIIYNLRRFIPKKVVISIKNSIKNPENFENKLFSIKLTALFYLILIFCILYIYTSSKLILFLSIPTVLILNYLIDNHVIKIYQSQNQKFKSSLPDFVSRLSLLINSGLNLRQSIDFVIEHSESEVGDRLKEVKLYIKNGMSELEAYNTVISKTDDIIIRKFISNIIQSLEKGGDQIEKNLALIKKETDEYRKNQIILKTQEANRKLLIPNLITFSGILLIVMLPILLNSF